MKVFKFGGASVGSVEAVRNLGRILLQYKDESLVVVISAMGKSTNKLEKLVQLSLNKEKYEVELRELLDFHQDMARQLTEKTSDRTEKLLSQLDERLRNVQADPWVLAYDKIVPYGELLSTSIIADFLSETMQVKWMDARRFIATDGFHTEANIEWAITERAVPEILEPVLEDAMVITQGFIGSNAVRETTTLGREGSDFTGAILAYCLNAESMTVWKDVPGILNADPKLRKDARQFGRISYKEITEMTYYGAKVIHPKTLRPLAQKKIPLLVRSFVDFDQMGTIISEDESSEHLPVYITKDNQLFITAEVEDNSFMDEKSLSIILGLLDNHNVKINLMQNSALTFSFCMDNKTYKLQPIVDALSKHFKVKYEAPLHLVTIKNYTEEALEQLDVQIKDEVLVQKTSSTFQVVFR